MNQYTWKVPGVYSIHHAGVDYISEQSILAVLDAAMLASLKAGNKADDIDVRTIQMIRTAFEGLEHKP
jgi:hypothetical protein